MILIIIYICYDEHYCMLDKTEESDIEKEDGNENVKIEIPFNPDLIKVEYEPYSVGLLIQDYKLGAINTDTDFQRKAGLWEIDKKSRFIESLILNLPIPSFYFSENDKNSWDVIDGLQRITTIKEFFIEHKFALKNLEFLGDKFNGKFANDLSAFPVTLLTKIERYKITAHIIRKGTPPEVKYNIFRRVNTGGLVLTQQEIRHALNQGNPAELLADMVRSSPEIDEETNTIKIRQNSDSSITKLTSTTSGKAFALATGSKIPSKRMEDRDFANRFLAFYLLGYENYKPDLDSFLSSALAKVKELGQEQINILKIDFEKSMQTSISIFGNDAFRKRKHKDDRRKPINKALFEVISVQLAILTDIQRATLIKRKSRLIKKFMTLQNRPDQKFWLSITSGTAQKEFVEQRHKDFKELILDVLEDD